MGLKYVAAYLMSALAGKESPSEADVKKILAAVDAECDDELVKTLVSELKGKTIHEVIAEGREKLKKFGGGGGGGGGAAPAAAAGGGGGKAAAVVVAAEEEEEDDAGGDFDLFG